MSVTIDSLDIQIRSSAGSAAANIDRLADSLKRLRENGKLTVVVNNLQRLSTALSSLQVTSAGLSSLRGLAGAMKALSSVQKSAGLNSILNALSRLPGIVNSLDSTTLATFTLRIQQLAAALRPLATELERVGTAFSRLPARIQQIVTATNRLNTNLEEVESNLQNLDVNGLNFASFVTGLQGVMAALQGVRDQLVAYISDAIEWDGIQFRFGRAFGEDADMVYQYAQKVSDTLKINMQQFMQYSSLYGSLLSGFGMEQEKVTTISIGLTELSYDIWAAYNDRYKTLEDASEAVRSAITGEIEPIRNAGIALTEASMQEYLDSLGMAHIRMANLSEAQKAQVRYAVMMESAMNQGIIGTYAAEMHTAEGAVRTLSQQMKSLGQAIGSIFIPILSAVIPWISAFVSILYDAIAAVAAFFSIPFFKINWGSPTKGLSSGLGDVAESAGAAEKALGGAGGAAKKLKDYTMGFDELNIIDPDSASGGGGGGGGGGAEAGEADWEGLDLETMWDESVFAKAAKQVDELKQKILDWFGKWKAEIAIISGALATLSIAALLTKLGTALQWGEKFLGVMGSIKKLASTAIVITLSFALTKASFANFMSEDGSFWDYVAGLIIGGAASWVLYSMWGPAGLAIGFGVTAVASVSAIIEEGGFNGETFLVGLTGLASAIASFAVAWKKTNLPAIIGDIGAFFALLRAGNSLPSVLAAAFPNLANAIAPVLGEFGAFFALLREGNSIWSVLAAAFPKLANALSPFLGQISAFFSLLRDGNSLWSVLSAAFPGIANAISTAVTAVGSFLGAITGPMIAAGAAIIAAIASVVLFLSRNWEKVTEAAKNFFNENIVPKLESMKESWEKIKEALSPAVELFKKASEWVKDLAKSFTEWWNEVEPLKVALDWINDGLKKITKPIKNAAKAFGEWWKEVKPLKTALGWLGDALEFVGGVIFAFLSGALAGAFSALVTMIEGFVQTFSGIIQIVSGVVQFLVALFTGGDVQEAVDLMISGIVDTFKGLWKMISAPIIEFWNGVVDWFWSLWDELVGHSIVPDMINAIVDWFLSLPGKIFGAVEEFIKGIIDRFKNMWSDIQDWWGSKVAPKFTEEYWKKVFETIRSAISTKLQEVKQKAAEKWAEIKEWFNLHVAPKFTVSYWKEKFDSMRSALSDKLGEVKKAAQDKWDEIKRWFDTNIAPKFTKDYWADKFSGLKDGLAEAIRGGINAAVAKINSFINWLNGHLKITLPAITIAGKSVFDGANFQVVSIPNIPQFAQGGVIEDGLFTMNRGEIAGKFTNGKSVVANNQMIVEGIAAGVYSAVVAAMNDTNGGNSQNINVYLDGKQIYASVKKTEAERGVSLMGNQLGYAY